MSFNITSAKLTGNPDESGWSQVHDFSPDDAQKLKLRGRLFAVIATPGKSIGIDSVVAGRELLSRLHEEYFGTTNSSAFEALKASVERVVAEFSPVWGGVEIAAISLVGNVVYSAVAGGAQVEIFRDGMLAKILDSRDTPISASGYPQNGDILIAGSGEFFSSFPGGVLKGALEGGDPKAGVEFLAPTVAAQESRGCLGAVFLKFERLSGLEQVFYKQIPPGEPGRAVSFFGKLASGLTIFKNNLISKLSKVLPEREVYIRESTQGEELVGQRRRVSASVGIILLLLLIVSIFFGVKEKRSRDTKALYGPVLSSAQHEYDEAVSLFSLNPERARELFRESETKVETLISQKIADPGLDELRKKLDEDSGKILGEYRQEPELFLDLSLLSSGFEGDTIVSSNENLFILDGSGRKIVKILFATKKSQVVAGPNQIEAAYGMAAYSDRVFILNSQGVFEVGEEVKKVIEPDWKSEPLTYAYAGNLYILDKGESMIWRYPGTASGFSGRQDWFAPVVKRDLSGVTSWVIDGSIWLITDSGKILKFTAGNPQNFDISGVLPELSGVETLYSNEDTESAYLLDSQGGRVVVLTKQGEFVAQYFSDKIKEAKGLVVSEKIKEVVLLTGDKLYSIELKHLGD